MQSSLYISFNGEIMSADDPIVGAAHPGLLFGDGIFETIRYSNHQMPLWSLHFKRLTQSLKELHLVPSFTEESLLENISRLVAMNDLTSARIRISVYRKQNIFSAGMQTEADYIIATLPLPDANYKNLQLCIYPHQAKATGFLSNLKTTNYALNVQAKIFAQQNGFDDAVLSNSNGNICEATTSNIFIIKNKRIYTVALSEGPVAGVFRSWFMQNFEVKEKPLSVQDLQGADEILLTNALRGIMPVSMFDSRKLSTRQTLELRKRIAELLPDFSHQS